MILINEKSWTTRKSNQIIVMHEEIVQNIAMVEQFLKDCVVDAIIVL